MVEQAATLKGAVQILAENRHSGLTLSTVWENPNASILRSMCPKRDIVVLAGSQQGDSKNLTERLPRERVGRFPIETMLKPYIRSFS